MKIFLVENHSMTGSTCGIERYITTLLKELRKKPLKFTFITAFKTPSFLPQNESILLSKKKISNLKFLLLLFWYSLKQRNRKDHIYHLHHPYIIIPLILFNWRSQFLLSLHSDQDESFKRNWGPFLYFFYFQLTKLCFKLYDQIISPSTILINLYSNRHKINNDKVSLIKQGVDLNVFLPLDKKKVREEFCFDEASKVLLFIGRFAEEKGIELLMEIFENISQKIENVILVFVGEGPLEKLIIDKSVKSDSNIRIFDTMDSLQLNRIINCADVLVVTSVHEGGPLVVKEALACNTPVVSTDVGDVKEVIQEIDGCFIAEPEKDDFVKKILHALSVKNFESRSKIVKYGSEIFGEKVVELYKSMIED